MVGKVQKSHGARSRLYGGCSKRFDRSTFSKPDTEFSSDLAPCGFWTFPTVKRELRGKKFRSDQLFAAGFREVGGAL
jgi:hypothetical protein